MPVKHNQKATEAAQSQWTSRAFSDFSINESNIITGKPIVFNTRTNIGGWFTEEIATGAIDAKALSDVAFFVNHETRQIPVVRTRTGKLRFDIRSDAVYMEADPNLERTDANNLYIAIRDGDIDGMSFMFNVEDEEWKGLDTDLPHRIIKKISFVREVSAVNYPAYATTSINARADDAVDTAEKVLESARANLLDSRDNGSTNPSNSAEIALLKARAKAKY